MRIQGSHFVLTCVAPILIVVSCSNGGGTPASLPADGGGGAAPSSSGAAGGTGTAGTGNLTGAAGDGGGTAGTRVNGSAGTTGTAGTTGAAGTIGTAGTTGAAGANGVAGTGGASGATGVAGAGGTGGTGAGAIFDTTGAMPVGDQTLPRKLYIQNRCTYDIWNYALPQSTFPGGVPLKIGAGQLLVVGWSDKFSGRIWGRSECTGTGGNLKCAQTGNDTLAEFTLTAGMKSDWYDISLVDGFTVPTGILQLDATFTPDPSYVPGGKVAKSLCASPVCAVNLNLNCPVSQQRKDAAGKVVECVNGQSSNGGAGPTPVTSYMKQGCPTSYTFPFDDPQSLFTCPSAQQNNGVGSKNYAVVYCPTQGVVPGFY
jgi:hypothetical protein